jgi:hypothetical protein
MPNPIIKFNLSGGEIAPGLMFRSDLERYDPALRVARNYFVDYLGGLATRFGFEFCDYIQHEGEPVYVTDFHFSSGSIYNYCIVLSKDRIRFVQDGGYVLEAEKVISSLSPITVTAHSWSVGDWIKVNGETYEIASTPTANTLTLISPRTGAAVTLASGTAAARIHTVASPYDTADLAFLCFDQDGNSLYITHEDYEPRLLTRVAADEWTLEVDEFLGNLSGVPQNFTTSCTNSGSKSVLFAITSVNEDGEESPLHSDCFSLLTSVVDNGSTAGDYVGTADPVEGATSYRFYRSRVVNNAEATTALELGYIGQSFAPHFVDTNIVPDFTQSPLRHSNPFATGSILAIEVTAPGSGYDPIGTTVSLSGPGSGFDALPVVRNGEIIAVMVLNGGSGYGSNPTVTFTGAGTGATATATVSPSSDLFPAASVKSQQRRIFGGTDNNPNRILGSRLSAVRNFGDSGFGRADDPFFLDLDLATYSPIHNIIRSADGFFTFSRTSVLHIRGTNDAAISANTAKAIEQSSDGARRVHPLSIDKDVIYQALGGTEINVLRPGTYPTVYGIFQSSDFSNHLFSARNRITDWCWCKVPHRLVLAVREDGSMLAHTYFPTQNIISWTRLDTKGKVLSITAVFEERFHTPYIAVERNGQVFLERGHTRIFNTPEEQWALDSALALTLPEPAASISTSAISSSATITASASVFSAGNVGDIIRAWKGKAVITAYTSGTEVEVDILAPFQVQLEDLDLPFDAEEGEWTLAEEVEEVSGLSHLEGQTIQALADGKRVDGVVENGILALPFAASYVIAGLPFTADAITLPPSVPNSIIEHLDKNLTSIAIRLNDATGLSVGVEDKLYEIPQPTAWDGEALTPLNSLVEIEIDGDYGYDAPIRIHKEGPFHARVLGLVMELKLGQG